MSDEAPLKSAYELAMERLRAEDRDAGVEATRPLTDEQKATIAELRRKAQAKLAEMEILLAKNVAAATATGDPEKIVEVEQGYQTDRRRVESSLESAIARVRRGQEPGPIV